MGHSILFKQCGSDHMTRGRSHVIDRIVIHYKATLTSARNNAIYFSRNERQGSSAHYFVDDITGEIYQSVAEGDTAWHAGNWLMNCRSIGIEVASAGEDYSEVEVGKLARLVQTLMKRYGIGEGSVIRHYDVTGKICPASYIAAGRWAALRSRICRAPGPPGRPLRGLWAAAPLPRPRATWRASRAASSTASLATARRANGPWTRATPRCRPR